MKVKTHTFNGHKYDVRVGEQLDGLCDCPHGTDNTPNLTVTCEPNTKRELISIIHECLHAEDWRKSERVVDRVSTEIGSFLWRLGYRKK